MKATLDHIDTLVSAVLGNKVSQDEIPKGMRKGGVKNPAVAVFGWGTWLKDKPTEGLKDQIKEIAKLTVS